MFCLCATVVTVIVSSCHPTINGFKKGEAPGCTHRKAINKCVGCPEKETNVAAVYSQRKSSGTLLKLNTTSVPSPMRIHTIVLPNQFIPSDPANEAI
jgi:hypothetical protein